MKLLYKILFSLFIFNLSYSQISSDCSTAVPICGNITSGGNVNGLGVDDFNGAGNSGCLFSGGGGVTTVESNSAWYTFTVQNSGQFGFNIDPNVNSEDWDYALYGPFATNSGNCGLNLGNPVKCNYSGSTSNQGFTGVGVNPVTTTQTVQYDSWLNVSAGETYILLINNYSATNNGFSLSFSGSIFNTYPNTLDCSVVCGISLGPDQRYCSTTTNSHVLTANFNLAPTTPGTPTYSWFLEGVLQTTTTTNTLVITQNGNWSVEVVRPGCSDVATDTVLITFDAPPTLNTPVSPIDIGCGPFDLTTLIPALVSPELPADFVVYFYEDFVDCLDGNANFIPTPTAYAPTASIDVYIRVENLGNPTCFNFDMVSLVYNCSALNASVSANTICSGNTGTVTFTGTPNALVNYTVDGVLAPAITLDATGQFILTTSVLTANSVYTLVDVSDGTTTTPLTASATVSVIALPTASISGTTDICFGSSTNLTFTGTADAIVTYTDGTSNFTTTLVGGTSTVSVSPTTTTTYSLVSVATNTTPVCTATPPGSAVVTVSQQVSGSLSYTPSDFCTIDFGTYAPTVVISGAGTGTCASTTPEYTATPAGLTIDAITGVITPSTSSVGTYIIRLRYPACGGCGVADLTTTVTVSSPGSATLSYTTPLCANDAATYAPTLLGAASATNFTATPAGLAIDLITGVISPSGSTAGTYTINYSPASVGACVITGTPTTVTITAAPTAAISYAATPYCGDIATSQAVTFTGTNAYTGGSFTANPTTGLLLDASTGAITPSGSTAGTYTVTYTIPASAGCSSSTVSTTVTITGVPTAAISYAATPYCDNITTSQSITFTGTNAYTGGSFTATPTTGLLLDASTGAITPSGSTAGTYTVTYTIPASAGCGSSTVTTTVTITAAPTAAISYAATPYCGDIATSQAVTFTGTNAYTGGSFTANPTTGLLLDASTGAITPSGSTAGTYTVTYTIPASAGCSSSTVSTTVTITGVPTAAISYAATPYCDNITTSQSITFTGTNAYTGGSFTATPTTGLLLDASTGAITPSGSTAGTYTVTYTIPASAGCGSSTVTTTVTITAAPTAAISYAATPYCGDIATSQAVTFTGTNAYTGGSFTANPTTGLLLDASTGAITPSGSTAGTYTVTYTIPASAGCSSSTVSTTVTITGVPTAAISYAATPYCDNITTSQSITFTGTNAYTGGSFTATPTTGLLLDASTGAITPSGSTAGTYTVTYTIPASAGCGSSTVTTTVTITAAPTAAISYAATPYCGDIATSQAVTFTGTNAYTGGSFTANPTTGLLLDASTGAITPSGSIAGTYTVTYTIPASAGCSSSTVSTTVTITGVPTAAISYAATPYCDNITTSQSITFTGTNAYTGGSFTANPTTGLLLDASTGAITPSGSIAGTYTVTYTIPASAGCGSSTVTTTVTITAAPTAAISYAATPYCGDIATAQPITFTGTNAYTGGSFTANPTTGLLLDASTGAITPSGSIAGTYTVTYTIPASAGCSSSTVSTTVTITGVPTAAISYAATPYCDNITTSQSITFTGTNAYTGGSFTANPTTGLLLDASTGAITPSGSIAGTYTVTYTIPASAGCGSSTVTTTVTITAAPTAAISYAATPYCGDIATPQAVTFTGTNAYTGGSFTANPTTGLLLDASTGAITPSGSTAGTYTVTYTIPASAGCSSSTVSTTVTITGVPTAAISYAATPYCDNITTSQSITFTGTNAYTGGSFTATPTTGLLLDASTGAITPSGSTAGTYTVTYTIPASAGCGSSTVTTTVTVTSGIVPIFDPVSEVCEGVSPNLPPTSINGITGVWQLLSSTANDATYEFTPDAGQCALKTQMVVQINPLPEVIWTVTPASRSICSGDTVTIQLRSNVPGETFSWTSNSPTVSGHSSSVLGSTATVISQPLTLNSGVTTTGEVTYAIVAEANGCAGATTFVTISVNPIPDVIVNGNNPLSLCSGNTTAISFDSTFDDTVFNWTVQSFTGVSGAFDSSGTSINQVLTTTGLSAGVVVYEVTPSLNGCTGTPVLVTVNVNPIPQSFGSTTQPAVCSGLQSTVISLSSPDPATVYTWIVNQVGVSGAEAGTSTGQNLSIVQLLTTTDVDVAGYVDYIITPSLNGCPGASVTIRVNVNPIPQVSIEDGVICVDAVGDTFQTHLIETGLDESVYDFVWYINNVPQANSNSANFIASVVGTYGVQVTNPLTNCSSVVAQANITSTTPATTLSTTVSNAFTDNATIVVTATGGDGTLLYQLDQGAYQESNVFTGVSGGAHEVTVIDSDGCTFLRENVMIIDYPKYFTPNGDGIHDTWNISGLNQVDAKLFIFDRYGKLIKQLIPVDGEMGWDGTYNQELLPSTDYWFTLDYIENGATKQFKAHFSMKR